MARKDDEHEVTVIETDSGSSVKWFLMGALLGAGAALLFAPQSGEKTRKQIARRARDLRDDAGEKWDGIKDDLEDRGQRIKERVSSWTEDVREEIEDGKHALAETASSAREELERRLADARRRRRAPVAADGAADDLDEMDDS